MKSINCYLYENGETLILIDAGIDMPAFHEFFDRKLREYGFTIDDLDAIILTHHHGDHIGLVNRITSYKEMPVYAHSLAVKYLHRNPQHERKQKKFFERLYKEYGCHDYIRLLEEKKDDLEYVEQEIEIAAAIHPLENGQEIYGLHATEAPGHSVDSILLYDAEAGWLFVGDVLLYTGTTNALIDQDGEMNLLPTVSQYEQSIKQCISRPVSMIFAGHQQPFSNVHEIAEKNLNRINRKLERIVEKVGSGNTTMMAVAETLYGKRMEKQFPLVASEVIGYLYYAVLAGALQKKMVDGVWHFYQETEPMKRMG